MSRITGNSDSQLKIGDVCSWRASGDSETVLGVDNAKSGICSMYVCMDCTYAPWAPNCGIIPAKRLFFKSQKFTATGYYAIENPLPDFISKLRHFGGC